MLQTMVTLQFVMHFLVFLRRTLRSVGQTKAYLNMSGYAKKVQLVTVALVLLYKRPMDAHYIIEMIN